MGEEHEPYDIRLARLSEVERLRAIEDEAGAMFRGSGLIDEALDESFPAELLASLIEAEQAWVACSADDVAIGVILASPREGAVYVEELAVLPAHGRRGVGGRLLEHVCAWARERGHSVTLSTFRDVPWNGPFYRKHGFEVIAPSQWSPGMKAIREKEAQHGLTVEARVFMRRVLK
jgi:GNAT superfamily N-acetyltransferase